LLQVEHVFMGRMTFRH